MTPMTPDGLDCTGKNHPLLATTAKLADLALALEAIVDPAPILAVNANVATNDLALILVPHDAFSQTLAGPTNSETTTDLVLVLHHTDHVLDP